MARQSQRDANGFTPTEARIIAVLADGQWHRQRELVRVIDELSDLSVLWQHICNIRKIIEGRHEALYTLTDPIEGTMYSYRKKLAPMING
jgi:hypothetical protein